MKNKRVKILFDANPLAQEKMTGVARAELGLIKALSAEYPTQIELVGHYFDFMGGKNHDHTLTLPKAQNIRYRRTILLPGKLFNMLRRYRIPVFYEVLVKERGDFILFPNYLGWPSLFRTPSAPCVHDTTYIELPEYISKPNLFDLRTILPSTLKRSSFLMTDSYASRDDLRAAFPHYNKPLVVTYVPLVDAVTLPSHRAEKYIAESGVRSPYLLFFGTLEPRKNLVGLLRAYMLLPKSIQDMYSLVVAGGKGWNDSEILDILEKAKNEGLSIIQTGYVSDKQKAALFMKATVIVVPSHHEGFGMQLLEAMYYETPLIVNDIPVLREVAGDAALYCNASADSIASAIQKLLGDENLRRQITIHGKKRLRDFSWPDIARRVYEAISNVLLVTKE